MKKEFTLQKTVLALLALATAGTMKAQEPADSVAVPLFDELDEVVIAADRPVMHTDGAKLTYNVDEDPAAASSTAMDILKKVPQVSVDGDGNVRLNGSGAFKFQVNGLDNPMLKQYAGQVLEAMPASAIVKIEVITEPGAKEDAEGTAGIINIITERTRSSDGYNGRIALQGGNRTLTPSLYGIVKKNKFTISANVNYQWGFSPQKGENHTDITYLDPAAAGRLSSVIGQQAKHHYLGGNINMSWEPNARNLFTAGGDVMYLDANLNRLYGTTDMFSPAGQLLWSFRQDGNGAFKIFNLSANASYRHNFSLEGSNYLVLSYLFNYGRDNISLFRNYQGVANYTPEYDYESSRSKTFDRGHTVQADYANDFRSQHHLMEVGAKGIFRHNTALSSYAYGNRPDGLTVFPDESGNILQPQRIYSGYASYTGTFDPLAVVAGLRYEHTLMGITDRLDAARSFRNRLNDWVPNAALTWNFSAMSNIRLAYQMRISRPSIEQVNPYSLSFSPYEVREGNPDLTSEHNHIVSLKYSAFGKKLGGTVGVEYNVADNAIASFTYLRQQDGINTVVTSYANVGRRQNVALTGFFNWNIIRNMSLAINGRLAYNMLNDPGTGFRHNGWSGNIGGNWNYSVADVYKFSAYAAWNSRSIAVQGYSTGYYYYGLSAARDFLADKSLTLSISANNFLQKEMKFTSHTATPNIITDTVGKSLNAWSLNVSVSWKFGSLNASVKKTGVELNNDDINSSSNKGQTGL